MQIPSKVLILLKNQIKSPQKICEICEGSKSHLSKKDEHVGIYNHDTSSNNDLKKLWQQLD